MKLPHEALQQLQAAMERTISPGDVWWLPELLAGYPGGKDRFCLVAAVERPLGGVGGSVVHFVAGSRRGQPEPATIVVAKGDCGLYEDTFFRFWWSGTVAATILVAEGKFRGRMDSARLPELARAVRASKLIGLKRLLT